MWNLVLRFVLGCLLLLLLGFVFVASVDRGVLSALEELAADPWVATTLVDIYIGFFIFWLWLAYRETSWFARLGWAVAIVVLGNIATLVYLLLRLFAMKADEGVPELLLRPEHAERFRSGEAEDEVP